MRDRTNINAKSAGSRQRCLGTCCCVREQSTVNRGQQIGATEAIGSRRYLQQAWRRWSNRHDGKGWMELRADPNYKNDLDLCSILDQRHHLRKSVVGGNLRQSPMISARLRAVYKHTVRTFARLLCRSSLCDLSRTPFLHHLHNTPSLLVVHTHLFP